MWEASPTPIPFSTGDRDRRRKSFPQHVFNKAFLRVRCRATTLVELMVVAALTTILFGVAMSLLIGLRDWDRKMRDQSRQNEQALQLCESLRSDVRQAIELPTLSPQKLVVRLPDDRCIHYELARGGCQRTIATSVNNTLQSNFFAVSGLASWNLSPNQPGRLPAFVITIDRAEKNDHRIATPLIVHATVGADNVAPNN